MELAEQVEREVVELHEFFVAWFNGSCPNDGPTFDAGLAARLSDGFFYLMPGGIELTRETLLSSLRRAHGSNRDFRIQVRDVTLRFADNACALATYVEHQQGARNSARSDNRRMSTVLFERDGGRLRWHHLHETWLPDPD